MCCEAFGLPFKSLISRHVLCFTSLGHVCTLTNVLCDSRILRVLAHKLRLAGDFDFRALAKATPGYVGADLTALTSAAGIIAVKRIFQQLSDAQSLALDESQISKVIGLDPAPTSGEADVEMGDDVDGVDPAAATEACAPLENVEAILANGTLVHDNVRPSSSFFEALPDHIRDSSIASFLKNHPNPLTESQLAPLAITNDDFLVALPSVQPSSKREGFATVPDVSWADVGALHSTREELAMAIVEPIKRPELFRAVGVSASSGVLLWGPPGCGKTLLAKAVANESRANFISVKGPELLNKYVGESEKAVRQVFARARTSSPCVIFFDELDALVPRRDDSLSESSSRVVNTLLTELDGLESRVQTYVIAATNRPDMIDPAMCRPGRLDKLLYVDLPSPDERLEILRTLTKKTPLATHADANNPPHNGDMSSSTVAVDTVMKQDIVDLSALAFDARMEGFSGADLAALVREAAVLALRSTILLHNEADTQHERANPSTSNARRPRGAGAGAYSLGAVNVKVTQSHFRAALDKIQPSVSAQQRRKYLSLKNKLQASSGVQVTNTKDNTNLRADATEPL